MKGILENIGPEERAWMSTPFHPSVSYILSLLLLCGSFVDLLAV